MSDITQFNYKDHWQEKEINLERPNTGDKSLGFTISGGTEIPFVNHHFTPIIIVHIKEDSLVHSDKCLKLYDVILRVNDIDFKNIKHQTAVDTLRRSEQKVQLLIRRLSPSISEEIELEHNGKLGISIAGGIGQEYFREDHGIFITDIDIQQTNKKLDIGDRLLQISSTYNTYDLRFVTHQIAKSIYNSVQVNKTNYSFVPSKDHDSTPEHHPTNPETNQQQLIESFDFDDFQRYENRGKFGKNRLLHGRNTNSLKVLLAAEREQPHAIECAIPPTITDSKPDDKVNADVEKLNNVDQHRSFKIDASHRNAVPEKSVAQQSQLNKTAIRDAYAEKERREQSKINQRARLNRLGAASGGDGGLRWHVD